MKHNIIRLFAAATLMLGAAGASANLITNGGFELGTVAGSFSTLNAGSTDLTGWTIGSGSIDYINTYWQDAGSGSGRSIDLNGVGPGSISQSFATTLGVLYEVTFSLSGNPDNNHTPAVKRLRVSLTGASSDSQDFTFDTTNPLNSSGNMGWLTKSFTFLGGAGLTTLTFLSVTIDPVSQPAFGPALDEVSVNAVPVPAAVWLLGSALLGVGLIARKRGGNA